MKRGARCIEAHRSMENSRTIGCRAFAVVCRMKEEKNGSLGSGYKYVGNVEITRSRLRSELVKGEYVVRSGECLVWCLAPTVQESQAGRETGCARLSSTSLEGKGRGRVLGIAYWALSAVSVTLKGLFGHHLVSTPKSRNE